MTSERAAWEELRREIEALPSRSFAPEVVNRAAVLAIVDRLAAARGEPVFDEGGPTDEDLDRSILAAARGEPVLREALDAFFEDIDADWTNDNIRPGDFAFRFRHAADRLRAALAATPAPREDGWEELLAELANEIEVEGALYVWPENKELAAKRVAALRLAAARGEPEPVDGLCGECEHDENEHVHYCSHEEGTGSCTCNAEYSRLRP